MVIGGIACWQNAMQADREMRVRLLTEAEMIAKAVNVRRVLSLSGSETDLAAADYRRIKEQLTRLHTANPAYRLVYLMGRRPNGTIFIFVDSEPLESEDYSPPGQRCHQVPPGVARVFATRWPATDGPYTDRWGTWVTAAVPLVDPRTRSLIAVLGIDVNAREWTRHIAARCVAPIAVTAFISLLMLIFFRIHYRGTLETKQLAAAEARYRTLFLSSRDAIMTLEPPTWRFTSGNPSTVQMFKAADEQDFTAHEPWTLSPECQPDGRPSGEKAKEMIETAMREGSHFFEWTHRRVDGEDFPATVLLTRVDLQGRTFLQATVRDITVQKHAEETLRESREKFRGIVDNIGIGVAVIGPRMEILELNRKMREWFPAVAPGEGHICYANFNAMPLIEPCADCPTVKTLRDGRVHEAVTQTRVGDRMRRHRVVASPVFDGDGHVIAAIEMVEDITERLEMEGRSKQQEKLASIGALARGMAHEINNPIMAVMNYAQLIEDESTGNATLVEFAEEIIAESRRIATMTHGLLTFTEQGEMQPAVPVLPRDLAADVLPAAEQAATERGIAVSCEISGDLPPVACRRDQIARALAALLTNALEAFDSTEAESREDRRISLNVECGTRNADGEWACGTRNAKRRKDLPHPSVPESASRIPSTEPPVPDSAVRELSWSVPGSGVPRWIRLSVVDNGPGISDAIRSRIFDPFFTTKDRTRHSGLGLWICQSIARQHGGDLRVESETGRFTRLHLALPCDVAPPARDP